MSVLCRALSWSVAGNKSGRYENPLDTLLTRVARAYGWGHKRLFLTLAPPAGAMRKKPDAKETTGGAMGRIRSKCGGLYRAAVITFAVTLGGVFLSLAPAQRRSRSSHGFTSPRR